MNCLKLFGERILSRKSDRRTAGIQIRIATKHDARAGGYARATDIW